MKTQFDPIRRKVAQALVSAFPEGAPAELNLDQVISLLVEPPNPDLGDLAFGCFTLAKALRKGPPQIAQALQAAISQNLPSEIESVSAAGPYVNFRISPKGFSEDLLKPILQKKFFQSKLTEKTPKTMIEYSQPNTHKELHVGHMRNACLGNALVRLKKYAGFQIISSTFPGDVGTHVAKCLWYLKFHNQEPVPSSHRGEWLGRLYSKAHLLLEDQTGTPQEQKNREQLTEILHQLEGKSGEYFELWKQTREWSIELMKKVYAWAEIEFDQWYWESDVDSASVAYVKSLFNEGKLVRSEGAIGMDLSDVNLGFCLLLKSDGTGLYATKDLELARRKFQDFHIEQNMYVVDLRQALHFQQVFQTLERLGFEQAKQCVHLQYNFVELPDGAMSSRKGNIVPITELIEKMQDMVKTQYLQRYVGEWSNEEIDLVASQVAKGAIKYGMVKIDQNKKIVFDMNEWLKLEGDSGPFIQYSAARIQSLVRKIGQVNPLFDGSQLTHSAERKLMAHLMNYHSVVAHAALEDKPSVVCTYLLEAAKKFNHFYHECSIGQAETSSLKDARLALASCTGEILKHGLSLLGIPTPERM